MSIRTFIADRVAEIDPRNRMVAFGLAVAAGGAALIGAEAVVDMVADTSVGAENAVVALSAMAIGSGGSVAAIGVMERFLVTNQENA